MELAAQAVTSNDNGSYDYDIITWFDSASEKAAMVQRETLGRILELNYGVEYLKKWFGDIKIQEMDACALESLYTSLVPLASHADLEPFIQRIADGDTAPILTQQPITTISLSSGTTEGMQKFVPFTRHSSQTTLQIFRLAAAYRSSIFQAFASFTEQWKEICNDTKEGTLSSRITLPRMRKAVLDIISPNQSLASQIEAICEESQATDWHYAGSLPLVGADYGSTESWIGVNLDPSLPPEDVTFAAMPTFSYFEFIPFYRQKQDLTSGTVDLEDEPVPLSQVKVGQEYEIVLTTFTGLYRYRLGGVVEVVGFHNGTPKLNFICRKKLILTVNIDKNTEKDLQLVVERRSQLLSKYRAELVDFTNHADVMHEPGHYIIYWEIKGEVEERVLGECCCEMDASCVDHGYVVSRRTNSIGPLELCIAEIGTFNKIMDYFIGNGAALANSRHQGVPATRCSLKSLMFAPLRGSTAQLTVNNNKQVRHANSSFLADDIHLNCAETIKAFDESGTIIGLSFLVPANEVCISDR
ncbi:hypothetical protein CRYUN_Cryun06bG0091900 [Craigia yunnanensis]